MSISTTNINACAMARRSSARLANRYSTTPKRVSLSHDAPIKTPRTAPVKLGSLDESDEMPGAFPQSASPPEHPTPSVTAKVPVRFDDSTPKQNAAVKPSSDEMHPAQHQKSTAKPMDEARWLGFANMAPHTEPPKPSSRIATLHGTPTRAPKAQPDVSVPPFKFTFQREHSLELSPEAKKLMLEKREEAMRIREKMVAAGEGREDVEAAIARKIALPKGKNGRFSQAHLQHFEKMDSIASHPSAFRAEPTWKKQTTENESKSAQTSTKNLKRSPSKAQLDEPGCLPAPVSSTKPSSFKAGSTLPRLPRPNSIKDLRSHVEAQSSSPAKRVKRFAGDDATITRPSSDEDEPRQIGTPSPVKGQPSYPNLSTLTSPTQSSLARTASVKKSSKIPGPNLVRSPSKATLAGSSPQQSTPLLARSPSKSSMFAGGAKAIGGPEDPHVKMSPLLARSPSKGSLFQKRNADEQKTDRQPKEAPYLARSPMKMSIAGDADTAGNAATAEHSSGKAPLLLRSPMKMSVTKEAGEAGEVGKAEQKPSQPSLLSRSPMKLSTSKPTMPDTEQQKPADSLHTFESHLQSATGSKGACQQGFHDNFQAPKETPSKLPTKGLMGRFSKLRATPLKSILRSPQRLYSDDPAKVASGTHLATPPKKSAVEMNKKIIAAAKTVPAQKRVDFTTSTNARYERAHSEVNTTPSKTVVPAPANNTVQPDPLKPTFAGYPSLSEQDSGPALTPQKRRQTIAPGDFTFRAGPDSIIFGTSPNAPAPTSASKRPATIRHVSAEPQLQGSTMKKRKFEFENAKAAQTETPLFAPLTTAKKRKFEFENDKAVEAETASGASDKENAEDEVDERPSKRVKQSAPSPEKKTSLKRPTLGVRPKDAVKNANGVKSSVPSKNKKSSTTISQSRLAALAQPKKRG